MLFSELLALFDKQILSAETETARQQFEDNPEGVVDTRRLELLYISSAEIAASLDFPRETVSAAYTEGSSLITLTKNALNIVGDEIIVGNYRLVRRPTMEVVQARVGEVDPTYFSFDSRESQTEIQIAGNAPVTSGNYYAQIVTELDWENYSPSDEVWGGLFSNHQRMIIYYAGVTAWGQASLYGTAQVHAEEFMKRYTSLARLLGKADAIQNMHDRMAQILETGGTTDDTSRG